MFITCSPGAGLAPFPPGDCCVYLPMGVEICNLCLSCSSLLDSNLPYWKGTNRKAVLPASAEVELLSSLHCPDKRGCVWAPWHIFPGRTGLGRDSQSPWRGLASHHGRHFVAGICWERPSLSCVSEAHRTLLTALPDISITVLLNRQYLNIPSIISHGF